MWCDVSLRIWRFFKLFFNIWHSLICIIHYMSLIIKCSVSSIFFWLLVNIKSYSFSEHLFDRRKTWLVRSVKSVFYEKIECFYYLKVRKTLSLKSFDLATGKTHCGNINKFWLLQGYQKILSGFYNGGLWENIWKHK